MAESKLKKITKTPVYLAFAGSLLGISAVAVYGALSIRGQLPMNQPVFFSLLGTLVLLNLFLFFSFWRRKELFAFSNQIAMILWLGIVIWYWLFAPTYYLLNVNLNVLQLKWVVFSFFWEVVVVGVIFIAISILLFRPLWLRIAGKVKPNNPLKLYNEILRYPFWTAVRTVIFVSSAYIIGSLVLKYFALMPSIELWKNIANGIGTSIFLAVFYYIFLDLFFSKLRAEIEEKYDLKGTTKRRFGVRQIGIYLAMASGCSILMALLIFGAFQIFARERALNVIQAEKTHLFSQTSRSYSSEEMAEHVKLGERGAAFILKEQADLDQFYLSSETKQFILEKQEGAVDDFNHDLKTIVFFENPLTQEKIVSVVFLSDFYNIGAQMIKLLAATWSFVLITVVGISIFLSSLAMKPLHSLIQIIKRAREENVSLEELHINTADEFEELIHSFIYFIKESRQARKSLEAAKVELEKERDRLLTIISSMGEGLLVVDKEFIIQLINPVALQLLSATKEELVGFDIREKITMLKDGKHPVSAANRPVEKVLSSGQEVVVRFEDSFFYRNFRGEIFPVASSVTPLKEDDEVVGAVIIFHDVTVEKEFEVASSNFITTSSHQLRTPLTSMRWFSEMLLLGDAGKLTKKQAHFLERVYQGTERMIKLVGLLLQIARSEAGKVRIEPVSMDIQVVVENLVHALASKAKERHQTIEIKATPSPFPKVAIDQEIFTVVFQNILDNAIVYSARPGRIQIFLNKKNGVVEVSVKDEGIGIPGKSWEHVFEKFFRADNALVHSPDGWGLGLALSKYLVESWGGKIWCVSEIEKGSTFFFTIPETGMKAKEGWARLNE
ncbi:TPA: hypothetical protein DEX28_00030 [Patescibacteria group bacterium]|nr:hypothetical protein [Patescibacteria group bacterium]